MKVSLLSRTISTSSFVVPSGITADSDSNDDTTATVWLSGGTVPNRYQIVNRVVTSGGRTYDHTFVIFVDET